MSEYLGSAFASFVGHRNISSSLPLSSSSEPTSLPFAPLKLPPVQTPQQHPPPPPVPPCHPAPKRLRYAHPTVLIPQSPAPVPLVSPVSVLHPPSAASPLHFPADSNNHYVPPLHIQQPSAWHNTTARHLPALSNLVNNNHSEPYSPPSHQPIPSQPKPQPKPDSYSRKRPRESSQPVRPPPRQFSAPPASQSRTASARRDALACQHCSLRFEQHEALLDHVKHAHHRPFACRVAGCTACFSKQNHLSRHIRIVHNKERPFACDEPGCGSRFGSKSHLGDHTRAVHMRLRNFKCKICDASWSKRFNLEKHIRIRHLGEKPFKCGTCNLSFGTRSHVTRHELKVHKRSYSATPAGRQ